MKHIFDKNIYRKLFVDETRIIFSETPFKSYFVTSYYDGAVNCFVNTKGGELLYAKKIWWDNWQDSRVFLIKSISQPAAIKIRHVLDNIGINNTPSHQDFFILVDSDVVQLEAFENGDLSEDCYLAFCKGIDDSCITMHYVHEK